MRRSVESVLPFAARRWATLICLASVTVLAGCGGGSKVKDFNPAKVVALGDETSAFETDAALINVNGTPLRGLLYSVNAVLRSDAVFCAVAFGGADGTECPSGQTVTPSATGEFTETGTATVSVVSQSGVLSKTQGEFDDVPGVTVHALLERTYLCSPGLSNYYGNWVQIMARGFSADRAFGGDQCPQDTGNAVSYAAWGAQVTDISTQFDQARSQLDSNTLVTVLAGQNDIIAAYLTLTANGTAAANVADAEQARQDMARLGETLAGVVNDIVRTGAKVVVMKVPDLSLSPLVRSTDTAITGPAPDQALLRGLVKAFNEGHRNQGGLTLGLTNNGRQIVLVETYYLLDPDTQAKDVEPACDPARITSPAGVGPGGFSARQQLLYCSNESLRTGASIGSYQWADPTHLGPLGHAALATVAFSRVNDQL